MSKIDSFSSRVKVYVLKDGKWDDTGAGICTCQQFDKLSDKYMLVVTGNNDNILLSSKIVKSNQYHTEQATLIIWTESYTDTSICLSFQQSEGRDECLECIKEVEKHLLTDSEEDARKSLQILNLIRPESRFSQNPNGMDLLMPEYGNLEAVESLLFHFAKNMIRDKFIARLIETNFISRLGPIQSVAEDLEDKPALHHLFNMIKILVGLADIRIYEQFATDENILVVCSIMEFDPDLPEANHQYRAYIENPARFRKVIEFPCAELTKKIHESFRLTYLKETVFTRILDDQAASRITLLISQRNCDIVKYFCNNTECLYDVFKILSNPTKELSTKRDAVLFLQSLCTLSRVAPIAVQNNLVKAFSERIFELFSFTSCDEDSKIRVIGAEIFASVVEHDPALVRRKIKLQIDGGGSTFLDELINALISEVSASVISQYSDILRSLLIHHGPSPFTRAAFVSINDPSLKKNDPQLDPFVSYFLDKFILKIISPITGLANETLANPLNDNDFITLSKSEEALAAAICDLLVSFTRFHHLKVKLPALSNQLSYYISPLMKSSAGHVRLSALRYLRALIGTKDDHLIFDMINNGSLEKLLDVYISTNGANNMMNSACLEFFEFVCINNLHHIIEYYCSTLRDKFNLISGDSVYNRMLNLYKGNGEDSEETAETVSLRSRSPDTAKVLSPPGPQQTGDWNTNTLERDEEEYFEEEEEEASSGLSSSISSSNEPNDRIGEEFKPFKKPLVDYDDDEEDAFDKLMNKNSKSGSPSDIIERSESGPLPGPDAISLSGHTFKPITNNSTNNVLNLPSSHSKPESSPQLNSTQMERTPTLSSIAPVKHTHQEVEEESPNSENEDFTKSQLNKILHYEEEESHVHIEEPFLENLENEINETKEVEGSKPNGANPCNSSKRQLEDEDNSICPDSPLFKKLNGKTSVHLIKKSPKLDDNNEDGSNPNGVIGSDILVSPTKDYENLKEDRLRSSMVREKSPIDPERS